MANNTPSYDVASQTRAELFERFIESSRAMRNFLETSAEALGLTPPQAHALHLFSRPRPMRSAADAMRCEASYITHITDDLEALGLARRTTDPNDRRVKRVTLTEKGIDLHRTLEKSLHEHNPLAVHLDEGEQRALIELFRKLPTNREES